MSDLTNGADTTPLEDKEAILGLQKKDAIQPEEMGNNVLKVSDNIMRIPLMQRLTL
jgi:hypothetical protein